MLKSNAVGKFYCRESVILVTVGNFWSQLFSLVYFKPQ